ncbi:hypothetical protein B0T22DRAFT_274861 [Podospora appendiculata]|uniref:Mid2 domain-containing protein n=1 Tax=Podospora appendiculata TaxID=314037 RepID=A0AAE0X0I2_9PEZI|nr:hypothetical protein B0T22DRAFT_274861 [Podospora appendiculata]
MKTCGAAQGFNLALVLASIFGTTIATRRGLIAADSDSRPAAPTGTATSDTNLDRWSHLRVSHRPTDAPREPFWHGLKRDNSQAPVGSNTCGFFTGEGINAMTCDAGTTCTNIGDYRDCCVDSECTTSSFSSVCLDYNNPKCSTSSAGTICCPNDDKSRYCVTYFWATTATPNAIFTLYNCEEKAFSGKAILAAEPPLDTSTTSDSSSDPTSTPTDTTTTPTATPTPAAASSSSGAPVGPIVGGVVGGLAVIGIAALGAFYLHLLNRRKTAAVAAALEKPEAEPSPRPSPAPPAYHNPAHSGDRSGAPLVGVQNLGYVQGASLQPQGRQMGGEIQFADGAAHKGRSPIEMSTTSVYNELPTPENKAELP